MTVHVLHAGDGYSYLTKQVASGDVTRAPGQSLSDYYLQNGNPPGVWVGAGLEALDVAGSVEEKQMQALFGEGLHPDAEAQIAATIAQGMTPAQALKDARLGRRFPVFKDVETDEYPQRLAAAYAEFALSHDRSPEAGEERDQLRWQVATQIVTERNEGRAPAEGDVAHYLATRGAEQRAAVAGYDLVFTPVKSVSTLWALADPAIREQISQAHAASWRAALDWIQSEGALTRVGAGGVGQIETKGLVAAAFDHLDSRTGDPNLHTHVAVSTKVQGADGQWRSLDGRVIHALGVAASERYNSLIEEELKARLGVRFVAEGREGKRPVREIAGVDKEVRTAFSQRRDQVEAAYTALLAEYRKQHGREAPRAVQFKLAQQATLETRQAKEGGVGLAQRLPQWRATAERVLGGRDGVEAMVTRALAGDPTTLSHESSESVESVDELADAVLTGLARNRSTWNTWHLQAEAERVVRASRRMQNAPAHVSARAVVAAVVDRAHAASVSLTPAELNSSPAEALTRSDGESIYRVHGSEIYTSGAVLAAEERLLTAAQSAGGLQVDEATFAQALAQVEAAKGRTLNPGQRALASHFASSGRRVAAGIGPAGTGKTTAMSAFARAVEAAGGRVVGLAPSAAAAAVLGEELEVAADTLHKLLDVHERAASSAGPDGRLPAGAVEEKYSLDERSVLLVDEAGMAGTPELAAVLELAERYGASVRLLGDPSQLAAVGAGGALRLIDHYVGAAHLEEVHRFLLADGKTINEAEARASLQLREGDATGLDYYVTNDRTRGGSREAMIEDVYAAWTADMAAGDSAIMVAATNDVVVELNARARRDRVIAGVVERQGVGLHDGGHAGTGDVVVTRRNDRRLRTGPSDFVKNGDLWRVARRHHDGALTVVHRDTKARTKLPAAYVAEWVELGYAATVHRVQGMTVDAAHLLVDESMTRNHLYTGATRGRYMNRLYAVTDAVLEVDLHHQPDPARAIRQTLEGVLARVDEAPAALQALVTEWNHAHSLAQLVPAYEDAYARLLEPTANQRLDEIVRHVLPRVTADAVMADPSYPQLRARLLEIERTEHRDIGAAIAAGIAADARPIEDARWPARALRARLGEPTAPPGASLPDWITHPPTLEPDPRTTETTETTDATEASDLVSAAIAAVVDVEQGTHLAAFSLVGPAQLPAEPGAEPVDQEVSENPDTSDAAAVVLTVERERAVAIATETWQWWQQQTEGSWTGEYLTRRSLEGACEHGYAPASWDALTTHLRELGYREDDMIAAGVTTRTRDGRTIDLFRDRLVMPIRDRAGQVVGFTARANPHVVDERAPKYINTPERDTFHKRELLHGWSADAATRLDAGARAVFVEGPLDVAAIATLGREDLVPLAPCGTALTDEQLDLVRGAGGDVGNAVFLFDSDKSGREATVRAWERLTPTEAATAAGARVYGAKDPGELVETGRASELDLALRYPGQLTHDVIDHVVATNTTPDLEVEQAIALTRHLAGALARLPENPETDVYVATVLAEHLAAETVHEILTQARTPAAATAGDLDEDTSTTATTIAVVVAPPERMVDPEVRAWLERHAELISNRLDALVADVEGPTPPAWSRRLYRPPADAKTLAVWQASVREIAAYRDRYAITGTDPLGPAPDRHEGVQDRAYQAAAAALTRITPPPQADTAPPSPTATAQEVQLEALRRQRELARIEAARQAEAARHAQEQVQTPTAPAPLPVHLRPPGPHHSGPRLGP
ncbi:MobF family relaxase [Miniimonas sp. S16]|uniref:MobF family relaxase n=1 Tax=Miniimonas sp. S16 TaxID=2171623 RepID=UPI00272C85C5|nr:MobF family relaxase [Miniimonas sp. S16]